MKLKNRGALLAAALGGVALIALGASAQQQPAPGPTPATPGAATQGDVQPPDETAARAQAIAPARSRPSAHNAGEKAPAEIDWADARALVEKHREREAAFERQMLSRSQTQPLSEPEIRRLAPRGLRAVSPERLRNISDTSVARVRLPVLVPLTDEIADIVRIAARENAYTAIARLPDGTTVEMLGTRMRVVGGAQNTRNMRIAQRRKMHSRLDALETEYAINHHDDGVDLSFTKFNAAYQIAVYCLEPETDARCTGDDYVRSLADSMAILNENRGGDQ